MVSEDYQNINFEMSSLLYTDSAVGGSDYEPVVSRELTVPRGAYDGDNSQCVDVNIIDDSALEGDETFSIELTTANTVVMLGNNETEISISDNDSKI